MAEHSETPFSQSPELLRRSLPRRLELSSEDERKIYIPDRRYSLIKDSIVELFRKVVFSLMHEIGHVCLGHREHSKLAEKEANYFASNALCPLPMLEKSGLSEVSTVASCFAVSEKCAKNRLAALAKWRMVPA